MTHTPGPWTYEPENGTVYGPPHRHAQSAELGVEMENRPIVAFIRGYHGFDEGNANGFLVGAAPDLLAALVEIVAITDRQHDAWHKAHAAIAKARGREQ